MNPRRTGVWWALLLMISGAVQADDLDGTLREVESLLIAGEPAGAWALLAPLELDAAGNPDYDYLYGIAALDTGRRDAAVPALERVLAQEPDFAGARLELGRALYESGRYGEAERQFEFLLTQAPPPAARAVIERYLAALDAGEAGGGGWQWYGEVGTGWDSNANAATSDNTFDTGFAGVVTLDEENVESDSFFAELAGGLQHGVALGQRNALVSSARASHRFNPDADFVDRSLLSAGTALRSAFGPLRTTIGLNGYFGLLDGDSNELGGGLDLALSWRFADAWEAGVSGRAGVLRYQQDELEVQDVNRYIGAVSLVRSGIGSRALRLGALGLLGTDDERNAGSPYGNDRWGGRGFASMRLGTRSSLLAEAGYVRTNFDDEPGFFGEDREDGQWTASLGTEYRDWPARGYSVSPSLRYVETDSSVDLYSYDRWEFSVFMRRTARR
jgi:tetratricopeptide (TPR) repeat protein